MNKNFSHAVDVCELTDSELDLINTFTVKPLGKDEVFTFNVVLCDNEIDRDFERFDNDALEKLARLFVGKPGIFDHSMKSSDQTARIFDAQVVRDGSALTSYGEAYTYLKAKAYMPIIEKNLDLVKEISAGIKKEVSINCSVSKKICSICKKDARSCNCRHDKGFEYAGKVCHHILSDITDAYEWSFVAVPAQRGAGITKSYKERTVDSLQKNNIFSVLKSVENTITLSKEESQEILKEYELLCEKAKDGEEYRNILKSDIMRLSLSAMPSISSKSIGNICDCLPLSELKKLKADFKAVCDNNDGRPQLSPDNEAGKNKNDDFII